MGEFNILQLNCQRSYAVMCELAVTMREHGVRVALVQQPYTHEGGVRGLPAEMNVFHASGGAIKAAVVVDDPRLEVMMVSNCVNEFGVCVCVRGDFGILYVVSVYCQFGGELEDQLVYLDSVLARMSGKPVLVGMDANAVSALWHRKFPERNWPARRRGVCLEEWLIERGLLVLNSPSEFFTSAGPMGESDIDVTVCSGAAAKYESRWSVVPEWCTSDHNVILLRLGGSSEPPSVLREEWGRCDVAGVDWAEYSSRLREVS